METGTNLGIIRIGRQPALGFTPRTFIITGLGRSGTSMTAAMFAQLGLLSRSDAYEITLDDREFLHVLVCRDRAGLVGAIERRDRAYTAWAFKIPSIHGYLEPLDLSLFRNPHLVVIVRDVVATACRHAIAEYVGPATSLFETAQGQADLFAFMKRLDCPILFISYEKAVLHKDEFVCALANFAGIPLTGDQRIQLAGLINPDNDEYIRGATRRFAGKIDGVINGRLVGWCRDMDARDPVSVDLLVNDCPVATVVADQPTREVPNSSADVDGHSFSIDLPAVAFAESAFLSIGITGRTFLIEGSGKPAGMYGIRLALGQRRKCCRSSLSLGA